MISESPFLLYNKMDRVATETERKAAGDNKFLFNTNVEGRRNDREKIWNLFVAACLLVVFYINDVDVFAQEINGDLTYEEGVVDLIPENTQQRIPEKLHNFRRLRAYPSGMQLNVTWFKQEYAELLSTTREGTNMTVIPDVLNECIGEEHYVYSSIGTQDEWMEKIRYSMYYSRPAVLDINTNAYDTIFPYGSSGHFVNVSGYSDITNQVRITDPNDETNKNVWYDKSVLYGANSDHFRQAIIW